MLDTTFDSDAVPDGAPRPTRVPLPFALHLGTWALAVVGLAQPALALASALDVLTGGLDEEYFTEYDYSGDTAPRTDVTFWERWDVVTWRVPVDHVLLASAAVVVALAGLHLAGRGRWRMSWPLRLVAAASGTVTATVAAAHVVISLAGTQRPQDEEYTSYGWPSEFATLATPVATAAALAVFAAVAVVVLLGPAAPAAPPPHDRTPLAPTSTEVVSVQEVSVEEVSAGRVSPEPLQAAAPDVPRSAGRPASAAEEIAFPRPDEEDYECYRRPTT